MIKYEFFNKLKSTIRHSLQEFFSLIPATINWTKKLFYIVKNYDLDKIEVYGRIKDANVRISDGVQLIKDRTNIHADVHNRLNNPTQIIVVGRYNGTDYVEVFSINNDDLQGLIHQLKDMERYGNLQRVDTPYEFKAIFDQNIKW